MKFRILGRLVSLLVSLLAMAIVIALAWSSSAREPRPSTAAQSNFDPSPTNTLTAVPLTPMPRTSPSSSPGPIQTHKTQHPVAKISPEASVAPSATQVAAASQTPTPAPTPALIAWRSGYDELCEPMIYAGIQHCIKGPYQIIKVDPKTPDVRFETVLPMGYNRYGSYGECRDVNVPDTIIAGKSNGPGCYVGSQYPGERVGHMASRYPGTIVAFNGDFFSPTYEYGAIGLTVKNGQRLDGYFNDRDGMEVRRSSLSISHNGDVRIGIVPRSSLPNPNEPWNWIPDPDEYYSTIGGLPMLVKEGVPVNLYDRCMLEQGWCPDPYSARARTAVGKTPDGLLIVAVIPEEQGLTLEHLSYLMAELGCVSAINLDGGGSSQLWYDGDYLIYSSRPVAEGVLIFSKLLRDIGEGPQFEG
jgi:hypothetical protein